MSLFKENYLAMVRNAAEGENHMFRTYFVEADGGKINALADGGLSCAAFVSAVLYLQNPALQSAGKAPWLTSTHANVGSTEKDMERNGWRQIEELRDGAVITWEQKPGGSDGKMHWHQGFYIGGDRAVSNGSNSTLMPEEHHATYGGNRKIERIWWHPALDD
ncbi:MAG TPA: hypothetical protein VD862_04270 [Candidatus Paceibacterota bacterium]|nr:hypothetical protein [Candidatus Paceibacterota bacterium]